ncbi:MAG: glycoside hydrolase family 5 protein [Ruminococcus sp.]|nr:glycoside hydrolase family 5 protein [Ruminococcus sp.]
MDPLQKYGRLKVCGDRLTGEKGETVRLFGMSTHGLAWQPKYVCRECFEALRDEMGCECIRLALYTHQYKGYCTDGDKEELYALVKKGIDLAIELGIYVIADWHILMEESPLTYADEAERFFASLSAEYPGCPNLIYEICNEPNGVATWEDIKAYAERIIPVIRANSPEAVVAVGTPEWAQRCELALADPLDFDNVIYTLHFYAATHGKFLRDRAEKCLEAGLPIFVTECSITEATGDGAPDMESAAKWAELLDLYQVGMIGWSLSAGFDQSSVFKQGCEKLSGWSDEDLKPTGKWFREIFRHK